MLFIFKSGPKEYQAETDASTVTVCYFQAKHMPYIRPLNLATTYFLDINE